MNRPDAGHALLTDDQALTLAAEFDAAVANAPRTWMPTSADLREADDWDDLDAPDLSTTADVQAALVEHQAIQRDAARQAAHGYSVEDELREIGPEPSDLLPDPADWLDIVRSGDIPPHDGRCCPECGYPLTEAHVWRDLWWLCPVCDSASPGDEQEQS